MIGIYRILNRVNGNCYYGSSNNVEKRWLRHKNELNKGKHINIILQRAWNKYGDDNFIFELVESCNVKLLLEIEQKYLDLKPEYNIGNKSSGGDNLTNNPNRNEIITKMTKSVRDKYNSMTDEEKKEKYSKPKDKNPNWKGGKTFCKCNNRINSKSKTCLDCIDRSGKNNPFYNKTHSEETKKNISEYRKGNYYGKQNKPIVIDNIEYRSAGEASDKLGISMTTIRWRVKSDKFENYRYVS